MIDYGLPPQPLWEGSRKPSSRLTLQKTFLVKGDIVKSPAESIQLRFSAPAFQYTEVWDSNGRIERKATGSTITAESTQNPDAKTYLALLPQSLLSADTTNANNILKYIYQQYSNASGLESISLEIAVDLLSDEGARLGSSDTLNALFFLKNFFNPTYSDPAILQQIAEITPYTQKLAAEFIARNAILVNRSIFEELKGVFREGDTPNYLLHIIGFLTDLSSGVPVMKKSLTLNEQSNIDAVLQLLEVADPAKSLALIKSYFDRLYDFPVSAETIELQQVGGTFSITGADDVVLTVADFAQYDLSLEYNTLNADGQSEMVYLHYDWNAFRGKVTNNAVHFSFSSTNLIIPAEEHELFTVYVRGSDGMELWSKEYKAGSAALRNIHIALARPGGNMAKPGDTTVVNPKRLRGQILDMTGQKPVLTGAMVVVEAKGPGAADWQIVGSALSDKDGYFSLPYPKGVYTEARAVVSLMPDSPAAIPVHANKGDNRTISDDFIYLLLKAVTLPATDAHAHTEDDDCGCHSTLKATRLPDHDDLIHSDEYTQDLGAGCINLSTPNRTLREYNHCAVVRTSDPDVANYTLVRDANGKYTLTGDKKKIRRKNIDLGNPIRWQDAPDALGSIQIQPGDSGDNSHNNLSFYQAVTLATGHVLHYKTMFKADGYSLGELVYSLPLAPGQKKQIVVFDSQHNLQGAESQQLSVSERLAANITNDRDVVDQLSGTISEALRGNSSAETGGVAAAAGAAGSGGAFGAAVGVAGGYAMAGSNASQDSARQISQFFTEKLRNSVMQNADSYRQQNASVVSTVREGQTYSATTEVVANHNHCHSLTMMYFEVLRHYAIYQELSSVEECVFVPLLLTNFTQENIFKWRDVLAPNLLPLPSNTYLPAVDGQHPLTRAFDANERIRAGWKNVDFPEGRFADDNVTSVKGWMQLRVNMPRPKTRYDRIFSFPLIEKKEGGPSFWDVIKNAIIAPFTAGIPVFGTDERTVRVRSQIFDSFMKLDANYETVPPAQCIRVTNFGQMYTAALAPLQAALKAITGNDISYALSGPDFFDGNDQDRLAWETYAKILGKKDVYEFLNEYFRDQLICDWDRIFYDQVIPAVYERMIDERIKLIGQDKYGNPVEGLNAKFTSLGRYNGGDVLMGINIYGTSNKTRATMPDKIVLKTPDVSLKGLVGVMTLRLENIYLAYNTPRFSNVLCSGYLGQDVDTGAVIDIPLTEADKRDPKTEDRFLVSRLIDHLNSNLEHYNKVLWYNLDADRRYMLLDGFNVQVFNDFGVPVGLKSIASVIKNELVTIAGNSLVFPVSPGFKVGRSYLVEKTTTGEPERVSLMDHYKPLTPPAPYRISVPTKGLFMEAVQGQCNACEKVQPNTSQDWTLFKPDEPTGINALTAPTPTITDWKATFKDIAAATVSMQTAPTAPNVGAGLQGLSEALTKGDTFRDVTGLAGNQQNAASTYKANMDAATKMAEIAKSMATQEHNTDKSNQIMDKLKAAKDSGAINSDDYNKLVKQHLQQQIDGGDSAKAQAKAEAQKAAATKPSITDAAVNAINKGNTPVKATKTDDAGNVESVEIGTSPDASANPPADSGNVLAKTDLPVPRIKQPDNMSCWATTATMMMSWQAGVPAPDAPGQVYPLDVIDVVGLAGPVYLDYYNKKAGLPLTEKRKFLTALRMTSAEPGCHEPQFYINLLAQYGPLWLTTDALPGDPRLAPHARVLTRITGTSATAKDIYFHFNDPAKADAEQHIPYLQFQKEYEEAVKDSKSTNLFDQVFHFYDKESWKQRTDWAKEIAEIKAAVAADRKAAIEAGIISATEEDPNEGFKIGGPGQFQYTVPVHETMVLASLLEAKYDLPADAQVPWDGHPGTENSDRSVNEFFRGVTWNDDPACLLFKDNDKDYENENFVYTTGIGWGAKFKKGEFFPKDNLNITGRSHFGDLQFVHAMATVHQEDPEETLAKVMLWAQFTYSVAIGTIMPTTTFEDINISSEVRNNKSKSFSLADFFTLQTDPNPLMTVTDLFKRNSRYKNIMVDRRALGSLLHLIQDSYAKGHTRRELLNPEDLMAPLDKGYWFAPDNWGKFGSIMNFHTYKGQGSEHGDWDYFGSVGMTPKNIASFNRAVGGRDAIKHSVALIKFWMKKTAWDAKDGPKDYLLKNVFVLHEKITPADSTM